MKSFGDKLLYENLSFDLPPGGIVGIIGANGAGKSTLFNIMVGEQRPDNGAIEIGETVIFSYVNQSRDALDTDSSTDNIANNKGNHSANNTANNTVWESISDGLDLIQIGNVTLNSRAYISRFNFRGSDQQKRLKDLSGGERNRLHLAHTLKSGGNVLLLDEPTNDLDVETLRALEEALLVYPGCVVVISHDRWFLDRVATHILAFEGNSKTLWFEGNYSEYEADRKKRLGIDADQPIRIKYKKLIT